MKSTGSIHNKLDSVLTYFVSLKEHSRKGGLRASRDKDKDKDDRESGARSRRERQTSARKGRQAHGAASPPPSITPAAEDDKGLVLVRTVLLALHARTLIRHNSSGVVRRCQEIKTFQSAPPLF